MTLPTGKRVRVTVEGAADGVVEDHAPPEAAPVSSAITSIPPATSAADPHQLAVSPDGPVSPAALPPAPDVVPPTGGPIMRTGPSFSPPPRYEPAKPAPRPVVPPHIPGTDAPPPVDPIPAATAVEKAGPPSGTYVAVRAFNFRFRGGLSLTAVRQGQLFRDPQEVRELLAQHAPVAPAESVTQVVVCPRCGGDVIVATVAVNGETLQHLNTGAPPAWLPLLPGQIRPA